MTHFQLSLLPNANPILSSVLSRTTTLPWHKKSLISNLQGYQIVPKNFPQNENQKRDSKQIIQRGTRTRGLTLRWRATTSPGSDRRDPPRSGGGGEERGRWRQQWGTGEERGRWRQQWGTSEERGRWRQQWGTDGGGSRWGGEMKEGREKGMVASHEGSKVKEAGRRMVA
ncbi:hypothetical protein ZEAMMB73_Zm00001d030182 [Zea mays]|uniref:Uncharacterized protein n=1 Tax=Zea mays TaxID=4577 RepID=A0A1D6KAV2_MAIZE|nr:hypothetical protein ZEAMMB73_Zm00001d030182 [Zea mays]